MTLIITCIAFIIGCFTGMILTCIISVKRVNEVQAKAERIERVREREQMEKMKRAYIARNAKVY